MDQQHPKSAPVMFGRRAWKLSFRTAPTAVVLLLLCPSCAPRGWDPLVLPVSTADSTSVVDGRIRVVRARGDTVRGDGATIRGDSVWLARFQGSYLPIPRAEIVSIEREKKSVLGPLLVVGALVGVVVVVVALKSLNDFQPCEALGPGYCPP